MSEDFDQASQEEAIHQARWPGFDEEPEIDPELEEEIDEMVWQAVKDDEND